MLKKCKLVEKYELIKYNYIRWFILFYPNNIKKEVKKNISFANRGMDLEKLISDANNYYLSIDKAVIYKKPTPVKISSVTYKNDIPKLREISDYFYKTSGIYSRVCNYFAYLYRYDWYIVPEVHDDKVGEEKILKEYYNILTYLDNSHIKKVCGDIALEVIKHGAYYGYLVDSSDGIILQQLPINYCRSRFSVGTTPVVEFNMKFFDTCFKDTNYRMRVLKMFPQEFAKGYMLYKQGKLPSDDPMDRQGGWYMLEPGKAVKFNLYGNDIPLFTNAIPAILDLDAAQELDRKKQMQQLL